MILPRWLYRVILAFLLRGKVVRVPLELTLGFQGWLLILMFVVVALLIALFYFFTFVVI
jgi:hypothetical protein